MESSVDQTKSPNAKPGSKPDAKDDLKSLPMPEVEKQLGSSPDGLSSSRGAKAAGSIWSQRDCRKERQSVSEIPHLFLGPHPVDDRSGGDSVGRGPALAGFLHHPPFAAFQRRGRILGRTSGRQRHRRAEDKAGDQGQSESAMGSGPIPRRARWCRATSSACAWATLFRRMRVCWRATRWRWISPR